MHGKEVKYLRGHFRWGFHPSLNRRIQPTSDQSGAAFLPLVQVGLMQHVRLDG